MYGYLLPRGRYVYEDVVVCVVVAALVVVYVDCVVGADGADNVDVVVVGAATGGLLMRPVRPRFAYNCARCVRYAS
jgi:hypothetical protein